MLGPSFHSFGFFKVLSLSVFLSLYPSKIFGLHLENRPFNMLKFLSLFLDKSKSRSKLIRDTYENDTGPTHLQQFSRNCGCQKVMETNSILFKLPCGLAIGKIKAICWLLWELASINYMETWESWYRSLGRLVVSCVEYITWMVLLLAPSMISFFVWKKYWKWRKTTYWCI